MAASRLEAKADFGSFRNRWISFVSPENNPFTPSSAIDAAQEASYLRVRSTKSLAVTSKTCCSAKVELLLEPLRAL